MSNCYHRVKITGSLQCLSDMSVASGIFEEPDKKQSYNAICLAANNTPYIPASSLRGLLSSLCQLYYPSLILNLFGDKENKLAGCIRIYDAILDNEDYQQQLHTHNSINPVTGTAKDKHLYSYAYVSTGSVFNWQIEADNIDEEQLKKLLGLLNCLQKNPLVQVGKGQSNQQGLITWSLLSTEILDNSNLLKWLQNDTDFVSSYSQLNDIKADNNRATADHLTEFALSFTPLSPILINDASLVSTQEGEPKFEFSRNKEGQLIIPASSLKGVLRSQCRKILLTMIISKTEAEVTDDLTFENTLADDLINTLFGHTGQKSNIWLSDAVAEGTVVHKQMFNAVDRFTGGVAGSALYKATAATATKIDATLYIDQRLEKLELWQQGLLILLLRDAMESDLSVGWGKSKGYGVLKLSMVSDLQHSYCSWVSLLQSQQQTMQQTVLALHKKIEEVA